MLKLFFLSFLFVCPCTPKSAAALLQETLSSRLPEEELAELTAQHNPTGAAAAAQ